MSSQTGIETPRAPASQRVVDRMRFRVGRWRAEPNPLWMREMRQMARMVRTPIVLMTLTLLVALLMAALGGTLSGRKSPAAVGSALFQVFFSLAYFVVTMVGPALAANSIASEREGKTWEAVLLTGIRPVEVARGKFLAAYTAVATYIVALAPAGAVPFLFGGVTPGEVFLAFVFLFLVALLAVAFGLAVSSKMQSLRGALVVTLLLALPLSAFVYVALGVGLSFPVHEQWHQVPRGGAVWLPTALVRADFGTEYVLLLVVAPLAAVALPAWLLYEITAANLLGPSDDRSSGLKRWYLVTSLALLALALVPIFTAARPRDRFAMALVAMCVYCLFAAFAAFLFAGEPLGPSRRVSARFATARAGPIRRFLGPGIVGAAALELVTGLVTIGALMAVAILTRPTSSWRDELVVYVLTAYVAGFFVFVVGLSAYLRARTQTPLVARVLLLAVLFGVSVVPWIMAAMFGVFGSGRSSALVSACASPFYVFYAVDRVRDDSAVTASLCASAAYAVLGVVFFARAVARVRVAMAEYGRYVAEGDRRLREEDLALATAAASAALPPAFEPTLEHGAEGAGQPAAPSEPGAEGVAADGEPDGEPRESGDGPA
ncbi:MAG: ABC transporter permease [Myxococcales bacterium]|nr:ABC transporter permease [Myxococcales bacterium]